MPWEVVKQDPVNCYTVHLADGHPLAELRGSEAEKNAWMNRLNALGVDAQCTFWAPADKVPTFGGLDLPFDEGDGLTAEDLQMYEEMMTRTSAWT